MITESDDGGRRKCKDCSAVKPLDAFPRNASRPDGYGLYCKACYALRYRPHRERKAAREGRMIRSRRVAPDGMKWCSRCEQWLPVADFGKNRSTKDGLTGYCRPCHNKVGRETQERLYGGSREYHLRRRYGIGQVEVDAMLAAQGGLCAACRQDEPKHVDHDHATGQVRGMLCFLCNQALGNVRDDVARLQGLIDYLHRSRLAALGVTVEEREHTCCVLELDARRFHAA